MALFRVDFCGRGELADRQQKLAQMLSRLQKLSEGEIVEKTLLLLISYSLLLPAPKVAIQCCTGGLM